MYAFTSIKLLINIYMCILRTKYIETFLPVSVCVRPSLLMDTYIYIYVFMGSYKYSFEFMLVRICIYI
jgi:hypothetical protein